MAKNKFRNKSAKEVEADLVLNEDQVATPTLSRGERFRRGVRSQSGWLFVAPALILMLIFTFYPIVAAFINAFKQDYNGITGYYDGWGFSNFVHVVKGDKNSGGADFVQCLVNTLVFTFVSVPVSTILALLISVALNSIKKVQKAYQTILFLPYLTNALAMGAVFATFFTVIGTKSNTDTVGIINLILGLRNNPIKWTDKVESPVWELFNGRLNIPWAKYIVLMVYEVWSGLPFKILILFSALQSINKQYYDAAKVDGASRWTTLWRITTPMVSPQITYLLVTGIMGGMKQYSAVVGIFGEQMGLNYDMGTMVGYIYKYIEGDKTGLAFAGSLILFVIIMVITFINNRITKKHTTYR
ncbi:MAG: sugar ABC transporter permease [Clostridiales bacterium]|nr:sugar ABC transporter permease [Clostridiales bacterium]